MSRNLLTGIKKTHANIAGVFIFVAFRRDARVVEWDGLENRCAGNCTVSSNLTLSADVVVMVKLAVVVFFIYRIIRHRTILRTYSPNERSF